LIVADKQVHIKYWKEGAEESWLSAIVLLENGRYMTTLFCWHLCIEKLLKAHWVKDNMEDIPPMIHNLNYLQKQTHLNLTQEMQEDLKVINFWNIEGRYPDYQKGLYQTATKEYVSGKKSIVENIRICLLEKLQ
jgi:HEPN domain-containing protein